MTRAGDGHRVVVRQPSGLSPACVAKADVRALPTARSRRRRDDLLIAARQVFEEHGYFETKVADIARLASASHGTIYTYVDSKDDVLRALVAATDQLKRAKLMLTSTSTSPNTVVNTYAGHFICARIRPDGADHERCFNWLTDDERAERAARRHRHVDEDTEVGRVPDQDFTALPKVQLGLHSDGIDLLGVVADRATAEALVSS